MAKVAVYRFEVFDASARAWRREEGYGTRDYIARRRGATLFNTKLQVEDTELTDEGFYAPREMRPG